MKLNSMSNCVNCTNKFHKAQHVGQEKKKEKKRKEKKMRSYIIRTWFNLHSNIDTNTCVMMVPGLTTWRGVLIFVEEKIGKK